MPALSVPRRARRVCRRFVVPYSIGTTTRIERSMTLLSREAGRGSAGDPADDAGAHGDVVSVVYDVDGYSRSVEGVAIEAVRTGVGLGPSVVRTVQTERLVATESTISFPMYSRATTGDGHIVAVTVRSAPRGTRWCGMDLKPGMTVVYGPGADHTAVNPVGVSFAFAVVAFDDVAAISDERRRAFVPPPAGQVHALDMTAETRSLARRIGGFVDEAAEAVVPERERDQALLESMTAVFSDDRSTERIGASRRIDPRHVVNDCIEYAQAVGRIPSITELCLVAHVSERGLRRAFNDVFETPPAAFFRAWGLEEARRRLASASTDGQVSRVALDLGFGHLGRFSVRYRETYGESPSGTLRAATLVR